jgi:endonuclease I
MKQTAVEWLVEQITNGDISARQAFQQAKAMEKEQIIEAYLKNHLQGCWMKNTPEEYAEQYYKETYESKTNI